MRQAAYAVSMIALIATVAPAFAFYAGRLTLDQMKLAMNVATLAWFVATPLWMGRGPRREATTPTPAGTADAATGWGKAASWTGAGGIAASLTIVPEARVKSQDSAFRPARLPECVVERQVLADGNRAYVVTARGFSPGYVADAATGATTAGSVVWLQSIVLLN